MKHLKLLTITVLPLLWSIYFIFEFVTGRVTNAPMFVGNIALIILFALCGYIIYRINIKFEYGFKTKTIFIIFLALMVLDQGIKLFIKLFFFEKNITLVDNFLSFNPIINTDGSWLNARFGTGLSFTLLIIINIFALLLFFEVYRYVLAKSQKNFLVDMCFLFIFCGALCSLIDKAFYGGSLDFIGIGYLFIADIKDLYINLGLLFFILSLYKNGYLTSNEDTSFKDDLKSLKKFLLFIKHDIFLFKKK